MLGSSHELISTKHQVQLGHLRFSHLSDVLIQSDLQATNLSQYKVVEEFHLKEIVKA